MSATARIRVVPYTPAFALSLGLEGSGWELLRDLGVEVAVAVGLATEGASTVMEPNKSFAFEGFSAAVAATAVATSSSSNSIAAARMGALQSSSSTSFSSGGDSDIRGAAVEATTSALRERGTSYIGDGSGGSGGGGGIFSLECSGSAMSTERGGRFDDGAAATVLTAPPSPVRRLSPMETALYDRALSLLQPKWGKDGDHRARTIPHSDNSSGHSYFSLLSSFSTPSLVPRCAVTAVGVAAVWRGRVLCAAATQRPVGVSTLAPEIASTREALRSVLAVLLAGLALDAAGAATEGTEAAAAAASSSSSSSRGVPSGPHSAVVSSLAQSVLTSIPTAALRHLSLAASTSTSHGSSAVSLLPSCLSFNGYPAALSATMTLACDNDDAGGSGRAVNGSENNGYHVGSPRSGVYDTNGGPHSNGATGSHPSSTSSTLTTVGTVRAAGGEGTSSYECSPVAPPHFSRSQPGTPASAAGAEAGASASSSSSSFHAPSAAAASAASSSVLTEASFVRALARKSLPVHLMHPPAVSMGVEVCEHGSSDTGGRGWGVASASAAHSFAAASVTAHSRSASFPPVLPPIYKADAAPTPTPTVVASPEVGREGGATPPYTSLIDSEGTTSSSSRVLPVFSSAKAAGGAAAVAVVTPTSADATRYSAHDVLPLPHQSTPNSERQAPSSSSSQHQPSLSLQALPTPRLARQSSFRSGAPMVAIPSPYLQRSTSYRFQQPPGAAAAGEREGNSEFHSQSGTVGGGGGGQLSRTVSQAGNFVLADLASIQSFPPLPSHTSQRSTDSASAAAGAAVPPLMETTLPPPPLFAVSSLPRLDSGAAGGSGSGSGGNTQQGHVNGRYAVGSAVLSAPVSPHALFPAPTAPLHLIIAMSSGPHLLTPPVPGVSTTTGGGAVSISMAQCRGAEAGGVALRAALLGAPPQVDSASNAQLLARGVSRTRNSSSDVGAAAGVLKGAGASADSSSNSSGGGEPVSSRPLQPPPQQQHARVVSFRSLLLDASTSSELYLAGSVNDGGSASASPIVRQRTLSSGSGAGFLGTMTAEEAATSYCVLRAIILRPGIKAIAPSTASAATPSSPAADGTRYVGELVISISPDPITLAAIAAACSKRQLPRSDSSSNGGAYACAPPPRSRGGSSVATLDSTTSNTRGSAPSLIPPEEVLPSLPPVEAASQVARRRSVGMAAPPHPPLSSQTSSFPSLPTLQRAGALMPSGDVNAAASAAAGLSLRIPARPHSVNRSDDVVQFPPVSSSSLPAEPGGVAMEEGVSSNRENGVSTSSTSINHATTAVAASVGGGGGTAAA